MRVTINNHFDRLFLKVKFQAYQCNEEKRRWVLEFDDRI